MLTFRKMFIFDIPQGTWATLSISTMCVLACGLLKEQRHHEEMPDRLSEMSTVSQVA